MCDYVRQIFDPTCRGHPLNNAPSKLLGCGTARYKRALEFRKLLMESKIRAWYYYDVHFAQMYTVPLTAYEDNLHLNDLFIIGTMDDFLLCKLIMYTGVGRNKLFSRYSYKVVGTSIKNSEFLQNLLFRWGNDL